MIVIGLILCIILFFIMCVLSAILKELEKTRLENREIINVLNKKGKNNMTVEDVKSKKMKLEEMILSLISQFEEETKTKITDIQINRIYIDGIYFSTDIEVEV